MKKIGATLATICVLALTGCGAADDPTETPTPSMTVGPATPEPSETTASAPEPSVSPGPVEVTPQADEAAERSPEDAMLEVIDYGYADLGVPADDLLAAAYFVCDQLDAGVPTADIRALEGATDVRNSDFAFDAETHLCQAP